MKNKPFRLLALSLALLLVLPCVAYADEPAPDVPAPVEATAPAMPTPSPDVTVELDPIQDPENAFASALSSLFGPYTPRTQTVTTTQADGTVTEVQEPVPGLAGLDWEWLTRVALFSVVLVCLFKIVGVVAKK